MSQRDPFPIIRPENDYSFTGARQQQKLPYNKPAHLAQNEEPWSRLYDKATVASVRRSVMHQQPLKDSLDLHLDSTYDQHKEFLRNKNQTLYQKETVSVDYRRMLMNREEQEAPQNDQEEDVHVWVNPQKSSIHSIQGTIESHHNASTNGGYTRKHDGGFYST